MHYVKMHGAGNSFVILENNHHELEGQDLGALARRLCSVETGPGADGLIVITEGPGNMDFGMLFYNSDGSLGEMCGNGARCAARYGVEHGLSPDPGQIRFQATAGPVTARRITPEQYEVRLNLPAVTDLHRAAEADGREILCAYVELGNPGIPHAVTEADPEELDAAFRAVSGPAAACSLQDRGRQLRHSPVFPKGANVTFFTRTGECSVRAITFERGVEDFTLACGTGCGATAVALTLQGRVAGDTLTVQMPGGVLTVRVRCEESEIRELLLTGPTAVVEEGTLDFSCVLFSPRSFPAIPPGGSPRRSGPAEPG